MKNLNQDYNFTKSLKQYIEENFKFKINRDTKGYEYQPKSWYELRQIIDERFEEFGPGTTEAPIDFNDIDVSGMTSFYDVSTRQGIFEKTNFEYIDLSNWDVSNVKDMHYMFYKCNKIKSVGDLSNWDVSNVKDMESMFTCCKNLEFVGDLSNWNVSNAKDMYGMFYDCKNLESVGDISNWNISNVKYMDYMFHNSKITNIPDWYKI